MRIEVPCPAKINPFLAVGPPDANGYHPIRTVLQAVSLFDTLILDDEAEPGFFCDDPELPNENTVTKAMRLVGELSVVPAMRVELIKRIPSEAGLGGGSSDAGGYLRTINRFLAAPIAQSHLQDMAVAIGMDTPFFLIGGRARGDHYGEMITPLEDLPEQWYVIAKPKVGSASGSAYRALDALEYPFRDYSEAVDELYNDFERVAPCESLDLIEQLRSRGCRNAGLTGSGSAVFGLADDESQAKAISSGIANSFVAQNLPPFQRTQLKT